MPWFTKPDKDVRQWLVKLYYIIVLFAMINFTRSHLRARKAVFRESKLQMIRKPLVPFPKWYSYAVLIPLGVISADFPAVWNIFKKERGSNEIKNPEKEVVCRCKAENTAGF